MKLEEKERKERKRDENSIPTRFKAWWRKAANHCISIAEFLMIQRLSVFDVTAYSVLQLEVKEEKVKKRSRERHSELSSDFGREKDSPGLRAFVKAAHIGTEVASHLFSMTSARLEAHDEKGKTTVILLFGLVCCVENRL